MNSRNSVKRESDHNGRSQFWSPSMFGSIASGVLVGFIFFGKYGIAVGPVFGLMYWYFSGSRPFMARHLRVPEDFDSRERRVHETARRAFEQQYGPLALGRVTIDQLSEIKWNTYKVWIDLVDKPKVQKNDDVRFAVYLKAAQVAFKDEDYQRAIRYLKQALDIKLNDPIASVRLGQAFERRGEGFEAIAAYESALKNPQVNARAIRNFISSQIARVRKEGPIEASPMPGLKHMGMIGR